MEINKFIELFGKAANKYSIDQMDMDNDGQITQAELESLLNHKTETDEDVKADLSTSEISETKKTENDSEMNNIQPSETTQNNAGYESLAKFYNYYIKKYDNTDWDAKAEEIKEQILKKYENNKKDSDLRVQYNREISYARLHGGTMNCSFENYCWDIACGIYRDCCSSRATVTGINTDEIKSLLQEKYINQYTRFANDASRFYQWDINSDGKCDINDLKVLNTETDLNGDGEISEGEKAFLYAIKDKMLDKCYQSVSLNSYENNVTVDTIIDTLEICDENYFEKYTDKFKESVDSLAEGKYENSLLSGTCKDLGITENFKEAGLTSDDMIFDVTMVHMWMDIQLLKDANLLTEEDYDILVKKGVSAAKVKELYVALWTFLKPQNSYLKYIKQTDLSKEQLTEILNKINSASSSVQSQLSEIKKAIEEKLEAMK